MYKNYKTQNSSASDDPYMRSSLMAYQEVLSDKLKLHHQNLGTFNTEEAVAERRRVCVELGILREADQLMVKNVTEPLPRPTVGSKVWQKPKRVPRTTAPMRYLPRFLAGRLTT